MSVDRKSQKFELAGKRVFVAGHGGMVGSAIIRELDKESCFVLSASRADLDLRDQSETSRWLQYNHPDIVIVAAAKVGGIHANESFPADFLYDNLMIEANLIHGAHRAGVDRLLFLGSSCIYPKLAEQPIHEDALLTGSLESTNEWYAIAKIAGIKLCDAYRKQFGRSYISAMPTNLYGPGDNFHPENSHVIPGLIRRIDAAKRGGDSSVNIWGSGTPRREFLYVDDLADALITLLKRHDAPGPINIGCGEDLTILELATLIADVVGFKGEIRCDPTKPDGTPRKLMNSARMFALGWQPRVSLQQGLSNAYNWYREAEARLAV